MDVDDECGEKFPIWLQLIKPKRKRRKTKQPVSEGDELSEQKMAAYLPKEPNLSVYQLLTQSIILLLREDNYKNASSFDQLLRLCIQSVRSRDEIMDMFDYRFDDKFDEEAVIGKLLTSTLGVLQTLGLIQQLPGPPHKYQLVRHQEIVLRDIPQYIESLVSKRIENDEFREEEAKQLSLLAKKCGLKIDLSKNLNTRNAEVDPSDVFLPGRLKLVPTEVEKEILRRHKLSRREDHSKNSASRRNYHKMSEEARTVRLAVRKAQKEVFASCADPKSAEALPRMDSSDPYISGTINAKTPRSKNQHRSRSGRSGSSHYSSSSPRHTKVTVGVQGAPEDLEKHIRPSKTTLKGFFGSGDSALTKPILFDEITPQFKVVGEKPAVDMQPVTPRTVGTAGINRTASYMSMSSVTPGVEVDIPSFRVHDWTEEIDESSAEEDLSDEKFLSLHEKTLKELNAKWAAALEDRKRQKQEAREKAKIARINSKSPRSRRESVPSEKEATSSPTSPDSLLKSKAGGKLPSPVTITTVDTPGVVEKVVSSRTRSGSKEKATKSDVVVKAEAPPEPKTGEEVAKEGKKATIKDEPAVEEEEESTKPPLTRAAKAAENEKAKAEQRVRLRRSSRKRVKSKR